LWHPSGCAGLILYKVIRELQLLLATWTAHVIPAAKGGNRHAATATARPNKALPDG
jgi:hypothetical protein